MPSAERQVKSASRFPQPRVDPGRGSDAPRAPIRSARGNCPSWRAHPAPPLRSRRPPRAERGLRATLLLALLLRGPLVPVGVLLGFRALALLLALLGLVGALLGLRGLLFGLGGGLGGGGLAAAGLLALLLALGGLL